MTLHVKSLALLFTLLLALGCQNASVTTNAAPESKNSNPILLPVKVAGKWGYAGCPRSRRCCETLGEDHIHDA
jgi:hypothetical protein